MSDRPLVLLTMRGQWDPASAGPVPVSIHGLPAFRELGAALGSIGYEFHIYEGGPVDAQGPVVALWDFGSVARLPAQLHGAAHGRVVAWCLESPLVAHRSYHRVRDIAREAQHLFGYPGVGDLIGGTTTFHPLHWPNRHLAVDTTPWVNRKFLTMINSNKRATQGLAPVSIRRPYAAARILAAAAIARTYRFRRTWSVPDLYATRLETIDHFARRSDFDLYGVGWDQPIRARGVRGASVMKAARGPVRDKIETLAGYRFALAFENTVFPGYMTEKIFDVMFAGAIPIYLGAPDITRYIPSGAFVDVRDHPDLQALETYLQGMSEDEAESYRAAARDFIGSDTFTRFSQDHFVSEMTTAIRAVAEPGIRP